VRLYFLFFFQWERHFHIAQSRWLHIYGRFHWQRRSPQFDRICEEIFSKLKKLVPPFDHDCKEVLKLRYLLPHLVLSLNAENLWKRNKTKQKWCFWTQKKYKTTFKNRFFSYQNSLKKTKTLLWDTYYTH
jgi:hypothetical protein